MQHQEVGGGSDITNIVMFVVLGAFNALSIAQERATIKDMVLYMLPFLIVVLLTLIFKKNKYLLASIFLFLAVVSTILSKESSSYESAIFFIFSYHLIGKHKYAIFLGVLVLLCVAWRSVVLQDSATRALLSLSAFAYVFAHYYFLFCKKDNKIVKLNIKELTSEEAKLIVLLSNGHSQKSASVIMDISQSATNELVKRIRRKTGYTSLAQIMFYAGKTAT